MNDNNFEKKISFLLRNAELFGKPRWYTLQGGSNNRVFRIVVDGTEVCLKEYFRHPGDSRDRLESEYSFIYYAYRNGIRFLPKPLAYDRENGMALYEFIPGRPVRSGAVTFNMVQQAAFFYRQLNRNRQGAQELLEASEACFSISGHFTAIYSFISFCY